MSNELMKNEAQDMTTVSGYAAMSNMDFLNEAMNDDCAGLDFQFDRIKIPSGGGTVFEIPAEEGDETVMVKEITGVILFNHPANSYYTDKYTGGSNPPDCGSFDGITGTGNPGGDCSVCPFNQYGSGEGQAKACKNRRMLYILREGELFPMQLSLPTGSLKAFTDYAKRHLSRGRKLSQVVTRISLKKATSSTGIAFSQAAFATARMLAPEEQTALASMVEQMKTYAANLTTAALANPDDTPMVDEETGEIIEPLK